ncbi:MAG: ATP-binding protein [Alphaproteobacteria bacterium]
MVEDTANEIGKKKKTLLKRLMPQTLLGRSLLILITPVFLIQVVATVIFFDRHWHKMTSRLAFAVAGEVSMIVASLEGRENDTEMLEKQITASEKHLDFLITYDAKSILPPKQKGIVVSQFSGWEHMVKERLTNELMIKLDKPFIVNVDFQEKWIDIQIQMSDGVLNVTLPQRRLFSSTSYIFLIWVFCASTILLIIAILFMRNQVRPIRRLAIAAERFGKGRDVKNFKIEGAREVRQAGQAFLDMKTRIQRQISQRTEMLAGVSHDLRTPLTRLKLQVAMMGNSADIYDMKNDLNDMERMLEGYLNFVRGEGREKTSLIDLSVLLKDIVTATKRQGHKVEFMHEGEVSALISLRSMAFKRCITNIITNASKYADNIWVNLNGDKDVLLIAIEDDGPGIPEEEYGDVFRPFYRVDSSRNVKTGGVGLGLPIAMDIVNSHGGHIWLEKSKHGGLAVLIRMPL